MDAQSAADSPSMAVFRSTCRRCRAGFLFSVMDEGAAVEGAAAAAATEAGTAEAALAVGPVLVPYLLAFFLVVAPSGVGAGILRPRLPAAVVEFLASIVEKSRACLTTIL